MSVSERYCSIRSQNYILHVQRISFGTCLALDFQLEILLRFWLDSQVARRWQGDPHSQRPTHPVSTVRSLEIPWRRLGMSRAPSGSSNVRSLEGVGWGCSAVHPPPPCGRCCVPTWTLTCRLTVCNNSVWSVVGRVTRPRGKAPRLVPGSTRPLIWWVLGAFSPRVKRQWCKTDHLFLFNDEVKNVWSYTTVFSMHLHGMHGRKFALILSVKWKRV
jgi:hypothetical protein